MDNNGKKLAVVAVVGVFLLWLLFRKTGASATAGDVLPVNAAPNAAPNAAQNSGWFSIPASTFAADPIYQAFYAATPSAPSVNMQFNTFTGNSLNGGYIPIFGFLGVQS
jgi:hypothetical protein